MKKTTTIILITFFFLFSLKGISQSWSILNSGTTTNLLGVSVVSPDTCFVCGYSGLIMKTIDAGVTWVTQPTTTTASLYSICFVGPNNGIAVGDAGVMFRTTNGGSTWTSVSAGTENFRRVYFYNANTGYAVGGVATAGTVYKTIDGGATWNPQTNASTSGIAGINFTSATDGYFSVYNGEIFKTTDGGTTWSQEVSGTTALLAGINFATPNIGIAVGTGGVIRQTTDAGSTWSGVISGTSDDISDVKFVNTTTGYAVAGNVSANTGSILKTNNGGSSWAITLPGTARLEKVDFVSPNCGYAVGLNGTILRCFSGVGISENELSKNISVYPNPSSGQFTIELPTDNAIVTVENTLGQQITKTHATQKTTNLQLYENGVYIVYITTKQGTATRKLIVNR